MPDQDALAQNALYADERIRRRVVRPQAVVQFLHHALHPVYSDSLLIDVAHVPRRCSKVCGAEFCIIEPEAEPEIEVGRMRITLKEVERANGAAFASASRLSRHSW